ncbi:Uncharacterised protein [Yersinia frederiksenii]|nr:Uncharacterised protein [Yersinia frederiksenii]CNI04419.1 Uncharacterised protein [Yersinia frederiksenii]
MHLHEVVRTAPGLGLAGEIGEGIDMRNHALYACMTQITMGGPHMHHFMGNLSVGLFAVGVIENLIIILARHYLAGQV